MAKKKKRKISPADVPPGMTLVRSHTYGDHLRAKRGTYKKAKLNAALKKGAVFVKEANAAAKLFKDAINPYGKELIDNEFWSRLLSIFRRQQTMSGNVDFSKLKPFEFLPKYTLEKLLAVQPILTSYSGKTRTLQGVISYDSVPNFRKSRVDGYQLTAIVVFPDLRKKTATTALQESDILSLNEKPAPFNVTVTVPSRAKSFVLCLRLDGCREGKVHYTLATKGMAVIAAGAIPS